MVGALYRFFRGVKQFKGRTVGRKFLPITDNNPGLFLAGAGVGILLPLLTVVVLAVALGANRRRGSAVPASGGAATGAPAPVLASRATAEVRGRSSASSAVR